MYRVVILSLAMLVALAAGAQTPDGKAQASPQQNPPQPAAANPSPAADPARQMQLDLDQMDSLVNNMATQVSFIRDTNMSILLNTNVRLWTVLLRDLRAQMQQQQREKRSAASPPQR